MYNQNMMMNTGNNNTANNMRYNNNNHMHSSSSSSSSYSHAMTMIDTNYCSNDSNSSSLQETQLKISESCHLINEDFA